MPEVFGTARGRRPRANLETEGIAFPYTYRPRPVNGVFNIFLDVKARNSGSSRQTQKFEKIVFFNGYKNGPSLRLRRDWKWPLSVFLQ